MAVATHKSVWLGLAAIPNTIGFTQCKIEILTKAIVDGNYTEEDLSENGAYTGPAGIALALHRVGEPIYKQFLDFAFENNSDRASRQARFLCGDLGVWTVCVEIGLANPKPYLEKVVKIADELCKDDYPSDEILVGRAGYLAAALCIKQKLEVDEGMQRAVERVLHKMILSGKRYAERKRSPCPLMYSYHGTEYLGAAHGVAGILQMALEWADLLSEDDICLVREAADWLFSIQDQTGNFPSSTKHIQRTREEPLIHWCHGAPGVIYLALSCWKRFGTSKYRQIAERCGELIWREGILKKGPGVCHGVAGNGYALLALWRSTGDSIWLSRAQCFALCLFRKEIVNHQRTPDTEFSLFEGLSGTLCFLNDLKSRTHNFPLYPTPSVFG